MSRGKTIFCKNCGAEYYVSMKQCPNCHKKRPMQRWQILLLTFSLIWLLLCIIISAALWDESEQPASTPTSAPESYSEQANSSKDEITYIEISAKELWDAFEDNEVAAEQKYYGQYVKITGIVNEINSKDFLTSPNIWLSVGDYSIGYVQCEFDNSEDAKALSNLKKGQQVTITGTCGRVSIVNLIINGCELQ